MILVSARTRRAEVRHGSGTRGLLGLSMVGADPASSRKSVASSSEKANVTPPASHSLTNLLFCDVE